MFTQTRLKDQTDLHNRVNESFLLDLKTATLKQNWAKITSESQQDQIQFKKESYLINRQQELDNDNQFLRNLGIRRTGTVQTTTEPKGTPFDGIFKSKPNISFILGQKVENSKVVEQKRALEERAKLAASQVSTHRSLLDKELAMKEDQRRAQRAVCFSTAATQRQQVDDKIQSKLQQSLMLRKWQQR